MQKKVRFQESTQHKLSENECKPVSCCSLVVLSTTVNVHAIISLSKAKSLQHVPPLIKHCRVFPFLFYFIFLACWNSTCCEGGRKLFFFCAHRHLKHRKDLAAYIYINICFYILILFTHSPLFVWATELSRERGAEISFCIPESLFHFDTLW